jgi:hypothetical protein
MRKTTVVAAALLAAACAAAAARADQRGKAKAVSDEMFVKEAAQGGTAEVNLGQLALGHLDEHAAVVEWPAGVATVRHPAQRDRRREGVSDEDVEQVERILREWKEPRALE